MMNWSLLNDGKLAELFGWLAIIEHPELGILEFIAQKRYTWKLGYRASAHLAALVTQCSASGEGEICAWRRCQFSVKRLKKMCCCGCSFSTSRSSLTPSPGPCGSA